MPASNISNSGLIPAPTWYERLFHEVLGVGKNVSPEVAGTGAQGGHLGI